MKYFHLYILKCSDGSYYVGHTDHIEKRISDHMLGLACAYTSRRLPIQVVYVEAATSRISVLEMERRIKKWTRKKKETLIKHGWEGLQGYSKRERKQAKKETHSTPLRFAQGERD